MGSFSNKQGAQFSVEVDHAMDLIAIRDLRTGNGDVLTRENARILMRLLAEAIKTLEEQ